MFNIQFTYAIESNKIVFTAQNEEFERSVAKFKPVQTANKIKRWQIAR